MDNTPNTTPGKNSRWKIWFKRMGVAGFLFFLLKGIGWLVLAGIAGKCAFD